MPTDQTPYTPDFRLRALVVAGLTLTLSWLARSLRPDDAFIYAHYIQNALSGHGLVFNPGEYVNALTSVLDTWILLGAAKIAGGHILAIQSLLGALFLLAACLLAERRIPSSGILIASLSYFPLFNSMETSLFLFLLLLTTHAYAAGRLDWLPTLAVLALLTRFEGAALALILAFHLARSRRSPRLRAFLPAAAILALWLAFNLHTYGAILPQSTASKIGQGQSHLWQPITQIPEMVLRPLFATGVAVPFLVVLAWFGSRIPGLTQYRQILLPFLAVMAAFYLAFHIPNYSWYYAPFVFFLTFYIAQLIPPTRIASLACVALALCLSTSSANYIRHTSFHVREYEQLGDWIAANTAPDASIASAETGALAFHAHRHIVDIIGLTTPTNAAFTAHGDLSAWIAAMPQPDYIVVHTNDAFAWERVALASPAYELAPVRFEDVALLRHK